MAYDFAQEPAEMAKPIEWRAAGDVGAIARLVAEAVRRTLKAYLEGSRD